jgi:TolA-binding protein
MRILLVALILAGTPLFAQERDRVTIVTERVERDYREGLAAYHRGDLDQAEKLFRSIVERKRKEAMTVKSQYFLARTLMKLKRWQDASSVLIGIHSTSPIFYREWACDYLLGECRRAQGIDE